MQPYQYTQYLRVYLLSQINVNNSLGSWISLQQDQFLLVTQAFASPPDMASSGVWENVILPKTPTFEGVSGILYYIIVYITAVGQPPCHKQ